MTEHRQEITTIDELSHDVKHHFAEQRDFITFCFDRAQQSLATGLADVRADLAGVNHRLDRHELVLSEILNEVRASRRV